MTFAHVLAYAVPAFAACAVLTLLAWRWLLKGALCRAGRAGAPGRTIRLMGWSFETTSSDVEVVRLARQARTKVKLACQILALPVGALLVVVVLGPFPETGLERQSNQTTAWALILFIAWYGASLMDALVETAIATRETRLATTEGRRSEKRQGRRGHSSFSLVLPTASYRPAALVRFTLKRSRVWR